MKSAGDEIRSRAVPFWTALPSQPIEQHSDYLESSGYIVVSCMLWERLYNPFFKGVEFDPLLAQAGSNSFTMSPSRWVELTGAIGILTKNGSGGGTFAQHDIAFKFANWISVEFELYLVKEFQRLKAEEQKQLGWTAKRERSNMENLNSVLINDGVAQSERLIKLNQIAIQQMLVLQGDNNRHLLK